MTRHQVLPIQQQQTEEMTTQELTLSETLLQTIYWQQQEQERQCQMPKVHGEAAGRRGCQSDATFVVEQQAEEAANQECESQDPELQRLLADQQRQQENALLNYELKYNNMSESRMRPTWSSRMFQQSQQQVQVDDHHRLVGCMGAFLLLRFETPTLEQEEQEVTNEEGERLAQQMHQTQERASDQPEVCLLPLLQGPGVSQSRKPPPLEHMDTDFNCELQVVPNMARTLTHREDLEFDEPMPTPKRKGQKFRAPTKKTVHKDYNELHCQECVCKHMNEMLGRSHRTKVPPESASEETILKYNRTCNDKDRPSKDQFQADFLTTPSAESSWNIHLFEIFVGDYAQKGPSDGNVKDLSKYFMTYLQTLQLAHCKMTTTTEGRTLYEASSQYSKIEKRKKTVRLTQFLVPHFLTHSIITSVLTAKYVLCITMAFTDSSSPSPKCHAVLSDNESDNESGTNLGQGHYVILD
ncbi:hypothetical protein EI94DRAFT_1705552 [Lactarius quietus]|nr:hypothetical protein EI94DRAFT_1705552 [Lactarius quietus]